jgi:hypothetical protein
MIAEANRSPALFPHLAITERILETPLGPMASGFHIHSVDDTLPILYTESVIGTFHGRPVRSIRSLPKRPIALGPKTEAGHIDHIAIDFLFEPLPTIEQINGIADLYSDTKIVSQDNPNCCGILVARKLWIFAEGYPPLEVALGPKGKGVDGCDPRPAWPK